MPDMDFPVVEPPKPIAPGNTVTMLPKIENETKSEYIERNLKEYADKLPSQNTKLLTLGANFIRAMASKIFQVPVNDADANIRLEICYDCPEFIIDMKNPEQIGHCRACGCAKNKLSSLASKSRIQSDTCPKKKWPILEDI